MQTQKTKRLVLGEGEMIGHKHVLECDSDMEVEKTETSIRIMLRKMGIVTHDEHDRIVLKAAKHRSYNQVEFNPMDGSVNRVFD